MNELGSFLESASAVMAGTATRDQAVQVAVAARAFGQRDLAERAATQLSRRRKAPAPRHAGTAQ